MIIQVYRDFLRPGCDDAYLEIERDAARLCLELKCPHPFLTIESLSGPKEVWFLNGYESTAEVETVREAYGRNPGLTDALAQIAQRKADLIGEPLNVLATYRPSLSRGHLWTLGEGRFLVIGIGPGDDAGSGTVFETDDGMEFVVTPAQSRGDADALRADMGSNAQVFAVRPDLSLPSPDWVAGDPAFWAE